MRASISELFSWLGCQFRSRAGSELEVIALRTNSQSYVASGSVAHGSV